MDITENQANYKTVLFITVTFIAILYIGFTLYTVFAFGSGRIEDPLITAALPE